MQWLVGIARMVCAFALFGISSIHAGQIVVGQVAPLSGLEAGQGRAYGAGMQLYFNAINKSGGVNGHTFVFVQRDDGGRPERTVEGTRAILAEERPVVLSGYFGSKNIADLVASGLLEKERIALVGYRTAEIRAETPFLYNVRAGLRDEVEKLIQHAATVGITRLGLFYEEGSGAQALLSTAEEAAKKGGSSITQKASYAPGAARVTQAVNLFLKNPPQAIIVVSSGAAAAAFIEEYRSAGGASQLFAHSGADMEQLAKRLSDELMHGVAIAQVTPSPYKTNNRLAREFREHYDREKPDTPLSFAMMEGYIAAKVIGEAVRRLGGRSLGRESIVAAIDNMASFDLGGYLVGFRPNARGGAGFVELSIVSGGRVRQ